MPAAAQRPDGGQVPGGPAAAADDRYRWVALANTTAAVFMSALDGSIVIIALPAIVRGIHLDPLAPWQHRPPAVDDHGLPPGPGCARGDRRPPGSAPFHHGLVVVFAVAAALAGLAALASLLRGGRSVHPAPAGQKPARLARHARLHARRPLRQSEDARRQQYLGG
ncbi:MAG: hypothetical protein ACLPN6_18430 [Streptosporangiaceae bacterium]|jgi:hypothetical protein